MSVIGTVITGVDVVNAVFATVRRWAPDYLAELAEHSGRARGELPAFRSYVPELSLDTFEEDQYPACVVVAPGLLAVPENHSGKWTAQWGVGVGCVIAGQSKENTYELRTLYAAAVRAMVLQHPSLGGFASDTYWVGESYDDVPSPDNRTIGAGVVQFGVVVSTTIDRSMGLSEPTQDPTADPGDLPVVEATVIDIGPRS